LSITPLNAMVVEDVEGAIRPGGPAGAWIAW
jgi:hypothetical protein